jgi:hypothetical protein
LRLDPNNQQMQTALSDTLSAKNRPPPGGLFGAEAMMKLAMDPRTRDLMEDAEFKGMLGAMNSNPGMMNMFMKDPRMMLVGGSWAVCCQGGGQGASRALLPSKGLLLVGLSTTSTCCKLVCLQCVPHATLRSTLPSL